MTLEENEAVAISLCNDQLQRKDMDYLSSRESGTWKEFMGYHEYYRGGVPQLFRAFHLFILDSQGDVSKYQIIDQGHDLYHYKSDLLSKRNIWNSERKEILK